MQFFTLSLPEASFLYLGLALQSMVRLSSLRHIPAVFIGVWAFILFWRAWGGDSWAYYKRPIGYLFTSMLLCSLFWPEIVPFGRGADWTLSMEQVSSYAASQDPEAEVITAEDTQLIPPAFRDPLALTPGFRVLLPALTQFPLALARVVNSQVHRTFQPFLPLQWLLGVGLPADATIAIQDWTHNCYVPVFTQLQSGQSIQSTEDLLPWGNTAIARALSSRRVTPGAQTGISTQVTPGRSEISCDEYLGAVLTRTQEQLFALTSPAGTPYALVFQEDLGLEPLDQAKFLTYREILNAVGPDVPAPSLTGTYLALRGGAVAGQSVSSGTFAGAVGWLTGAFKAATTLFGFGRGAVSGLFSEWQRFMDGLSSLVGIAVFILWWAPYILGLSNLVLLGLFPLFFFYSLLPGAQFQPLMSYFITLLFTSFAPLWWALIDVSQRLAGAALAPQSSNALFGLANDAVSFALSAMVTVLGLFVITIVTSWLLFGTLRSIGGALRAAF